MDEGLAARHHRAGMGGEHDAGLRRLRLAGGLAERVVASRVNDREDIYDSLRQLFKAGR